MSEIKNILFVGLYPEPLNPYKNVFFRNLIMEFADQGIKCTVISPVSVTKYRNKINKIPKETIDYSENGSEVKVYYPRFISYSCKRIGPFNSGVWSEKAFDACAKKQVKRIKEKFDVVYGHFFLEGGLAAIKIARKNNIPSFVAFGECSYDTEVVQLYRTLNKKDIDGLSGVIAVSTHNANVLKETGLFDEIPMIIAPNAVDKNIFYKRDKNKCREILNIPQDKFIVGFVGGFIERKGDKRLLAAISSIDEVYGVFAGKGDNPPKNDRVLFCGPMNHNDIPLLLNSMDVFCLPTLNEGSCNAIVEAMACGVSIVSSDLPFNHDALNSENSILIDPNSIDDIKKAIVLLKDNYELRMKISNNAFEDSNKFVIKNRAKKIIDFMKSIYD